MLKNINQIPVWIFSFLNNGNHYNFLKYIMLSHKNWAKYERIYINEIRNRLDISTYTK